MSPDFVPLTQQLGGRDEYIMEQLAATNSQLLAAFPWEFDNETVFKRTDLGGGLWQEARAFWSGR